MAGQCFQTGTTRTRVHTAVHTESKGTAVSAVRAYLLCFKFIYVTAVWQQSPLYCIAKTDDISIINLNRVRDQEVGLSTDVPFKIYGGSLM